MKKRRSLMIVATVLVLMVFVLPVTFHFVNFNDYRGKLEAQVEQVTGRKFKIAGNIELKLYPYPYFSLRDVAFDNADWGSKPQMITAEFLDMQVAWLPLLTGEVHIKRVRLRGAEVLLETDVHGRGNWEFDNPSTATSFRLPSFVWVAIENAKVRWRDGVTKTSYGVVLDSLKVVRSAVEPPLFSWDVSGKLDGTPLTVTAEMSSLVRHLAGEPWQGRIKINSPGVTLEASGAIKQISSLEGMNINVSARGDDLAVLRPFFRTELPSTEPWHVNVSLADREHVYHVNIIDAQVGSSDLAGQLTLTEQARRWQIAGDLKAKRLKLASSSMTQLNGDPAQDKPKDVGKVFSDTPFSTAWLRPFDATLAFSITRFEMGKWIATDASGSAELKDGKLSFDLKHGVLFDGKLSAALAMDSAPASPVMQLRLKADQIETGLLLDALADSNFVGGVGTVDLKLRSAGNSVAALMANLSGDGEVLVGEGTADLRQAEESTSIGRLLMSALTTKDDTQVRMNCLAGHLTIDKGLAKPTVILIDTKRSTLNGAGEIDFGKETLDLVFTPKPKKSTLSIGVPISLTGSFTAPSSTVGKLGTLRRLAGVASLFVFPPAALAGLGEIGDGNSCVKMLETTAAAPSAAN